MSRTIATPDRIVVIKIGSNALVAADGRLDRRFLGRLAKQIAQARADGWQPVLVSSGAVACGLSRIAASGPAPTAVSERQALAAIGQADLIQAWQLVLGRHGLIGAQVLLTAGDFDDRERYLNLTANLRALSDYGAVPIINENDTVSVEELALGDNDRLSALVASQLKAAKLLLLTDIDGVYDCDPRHHADARLVAEVPEIDSALLASVGGSGRLGTGGMRSKLNAARLATRTGVPTIIAGARQPQVITRLLAGEALGTRIPAVDGREPSSRRRWLALARTCRGQLILDAGAVRALCERGTSLLPVGLQRVEGRFDRGDTVCLRDATGVEIGRGLVNLDASEVGRIAGKRWPDAVRLLGYAIPKTVVHRDNILLER